MSGTDGTHRASSALTRAAPKWCTCSSSHERSGCWRAALASADAKSVSSYSKSRDGTGYVADTAPLHSSDASTSKASTDHITQLELRSSGANMPQPSTNSAWPLSDDS